MVAKKLIVRPTRQRCGLAGMVWVPDAIIPPRRPDPAFWTGSAAACAEEEVAEEPGRAPAVAGGFAWPAIDYSGLMAAIAEAERVIRSTRHALDCLRSGTPAAAGAAARGACLGRLRG